MKGMRLAAVVEQARFLVAGHAFAGVGLAAVVRVALQHMAPVLDRTRSSCTGPVPTGQVSSVRPTAAMPGWA